MRSLFVVFGIVTFAPFALADQTCEEATAAEHFREATRLYYEVKDFARAATEFEAANACRPAPEALYGAGIARYAAGDLLVAARELDEALRGGLKTQNESIARAKLAEIDVKVGHLEIVGPADARVTVDDQPETLLPARVRVLPGDHTIDARLPLGPANHRRASVVVGGALRVDVSPNAPPEVHHPESHGMSVLRVVGLIGLGVGVATIGAGWITSKFGADINTQYNDGGNVDRALYDRAVAFQTAYSALFIAGGVVATTGLVLTLLPSPKTRVSVALNAVSFDARF